MKNGNTCNHNLSSSVGHVSGDLPERKTKPHPNHKEWMLVSFDFWAGLLHENFSLLYEPTLQFQVEIRRKLRG
ncbi:predicted protein [Botrytis cinerea T4]|uniref:Uncharacterized protein n=1 Tax=Botryotinia fuckeliana (strain T4) TaxID=999810 RepID=G2Y6L0_BOTF4|nr:predicted protein [Botrytis cinerea T4]